MSGDVASGILYLAGDAVEMTREGSDQVNDCKEPRFLEEGTALEGGTSVAIRDQEEECNTIG